MIRKLLFLLFCFTCTPTAVLADNGVQVDSLWNGLITTSGKPLNGGKVYTYDAGTSTPRNLYTNIGKTTPATNPIILNSMGKALVYGDGIYKFVIKDSNDVTIETRDNLVYQNVDTTSVVNAGSSTGSSNAYVVTPSPAVAAYTNGLQMFFVANHTNTGAATLNVSGLGTKALVRASDAALTAGDIVSGSLVSVLYVDGSPGKFRIIAPLNTFKNNETNSPTVTNAYDLGTSSLKFKDFYLAGTATVGTIAATTISGSPVLSASGNIGMSSASSYAYFGGNSTGIATDGTKGSYLASMGNSATSGLSGSNGGIELVSGNASGADITLRANGGSGGSIFFDTNSTGRWELKGDGNLLPQADDSYDIGDYNKRVNNTWTRNLHIGIGGVGVNTGTGTIRLQTSTTPTGTPTTNEFLIYVDTSDNKLKAKGSSGTVTILANP